LQVWRLYLLSKSRGLDCWYALPLYALAGLHHIYNITAVLAAMRQNSQSVATSTLPADKKTASIKTLVIQRKSLRQLELSLPESKSYKKIFQIF